MLGKRRIASVALTTGLVAAGLLSSPSPALAVSNSNCAPYLLQGPMCYYYHSYYDGARAAIASTVNDLYTWTFADGDGAGTYVANNAGSGRNYDDRCTAVTWEHVGGAAGGGASIALKPYLVSGWQSATLGALNNNNRSLAWKCP